MAKLTPLSEKSVVGLLEGLSRRSTKKFTPFYSVVLNAPFCPVKQKLRKKQSEVSMVKIPQHKVTKFNKLVCIPSSRQLKKYKIFVLPGWISGNIFMPPIVAFHEIPLVLRLQVLSVAGRLYSNLYIL